MSVVWKPKTQMQEDILKQWRDKFQSQAQWQPQSNLWYEQPKIWGEGAMEAVGRGISKVPLLPKAFEFVAPAFEFIQEKLEKPFAAIITSPFSPSLPWRAGEGWLEHEKREYGAWQAPTYVKGIAEFAMPLWWLPYVGWAGKGARALGVGNKMARAMSTLPRVGKLRLPADDILNKTLFREDFFKKASLWAENKPVLSGVVRTIGGPSAFVKATGETPLEITQRALIKKAVISDMRHGARGLLAPRLQAISDNPIKLLDIADDGLVRGVAVKDGTSAYLTDMIEGFAKNADNYIFVNPQAKQYVKELVDIVNEVRELALKEGVKIPKTFTFHRMVKGIINEEKGIYELSEWGSKFDTARHFTTMQEGATRTARKVVYDNNPINSINATIDHYIKKIGTKRFDDEVGKLGMKPMEKFVAQFPTEAEAINNLSTRLLSAQYTTQAISSIITRRGSALPPATLAKIRRGLPEIAEQLDNVFSLTPLEGDKLISSLGRELWQAAKITPKEFKVVLAQYNKTRGKILLGEIDDAIQSLKVSKGVTAQAITRAYQTAYLTRKQFVGDTLKVLKQEATDIIGATKGELVPLKQARNQFLRRYREGKQILGEQEKVFTKHPAFRNMIFPREVVELAEPVLADAGSKWLRTLGTVSGTGRMLIAALDFSAPFIQGLAVLGRNPFVWAKGVTRQFEFFAKPQNMYKYMTDPVTMAVRAERVAFGGSSSTFEFFEAMKPLQRVTGKVGAKVIGQTYGRAEAAFTGFGEVARNEMWKALRRKALKPDGMLDDVIARDIARSIDRMTGVMSMEAIGIPKSQQSFENAFVFFAPRYTRASLAYVGDIFKGGITGAEARKSLGALMASGAVMYYGAATALGQRPDFDINSPTFMTLKIGEAHIGIGGMLYGLGRLAANIAGTATGDNPVDLVRLSRTDNPFFKFMFQRTAPLTGLAFGAVIEQKNYFGEPLETVGDWGRFMAEKVTPIAVQQALFEKETRHPATFLSEVMGGRMFPKSAWELQDEAKDRLALATMGLPYDQLDLLQRRQIDRSPEVTVFQEEIDKATTQRGKALSKSFLERRRDIDDARFMHQTQIEQLQRAHEAGLITGYDFREMVSDANYGYGTTIEHINNNPRYTDVLKKLQEPRDVSREYRWELAYDELMSAVGSNRFEVLGVFDYESYDRFLNELRVKYGEGDFQRALEMKNSRYAEYPTLFQDLQRAKEILKPYWDIARKTEQMFGKAFAESKAGQRLISKQRKMMRLTNPEMERMYNLFYIRK